MAVARGRFVVNASVGSASVGNYNGREVMAGRYRSYGVGERLLKEREGGRFVTATPGPSDFAWNVGQL